MRENLRELSLRLPVTAILLLSALPLGCGRNVYQPPVATRGRRSACPDPGKQRVAFARVADGRYAAA